MKVNVIIVINIGPLLLDYETVFNYRAELCHVRRLLRPIDPLTRSPVIELNWIVLPFQPINGSIFETLKKKKTTRCRVSVENGSVSTKTTGGLAAIGALLCNNHWKLVESDSERAQRAMWKRKRWEMDAIVLFASAENECKEQNGQFGPAFAYLQRWINI